MLLLSHIVIAQEGLLYEQLTVEDGLPSNEVYWTYQDHRGDLWICTDHGVAKYNGLTMKEFTTEDGLPENTVFKCIPDNQGRLWFTTRTEGVFFIEDDSVHIPKFSNDLLALLDEKRIEQLHFDESDSIWIATYETNSFFYKTHLDKATVTAYPIVPNDKCDFTEFIIKTNEKGILSGVTSFQPNVTSEKCSFNETEQTDYGDFQVLFKHVRLDTAKTLSAARRANIDSYRADTRFAMRNKFANYNDTLEWVSAMNYLYKVEEDQLILFEELGGYIYEIYRDENYLMVHGVDRGISIYSVVDGLAVDKKVYFKSFEISHVNRDRNGHYWLSSTNGGLFKVVSFEVTQLSLPDEFARNKGVFRPWSYQNDTIRFLLNSTIFSYSKNENKLEFVERSPVNYLDTAQSKEVAWGESGHVYFGYKHWNYENQTLVDSILIDDSYSAGVSELQLNRNSNTMIYLKHVGYSIYTKRKRVFESTDHKFEKRPTCVLIIDKDHHFIGGLNSLYEYNNGVYTDLGEQYAGFKGRIEDLKSDTEGNVWVATRGAGIGIIKQDTVIFLDKIDGLNSNLVNRLLIDGKSVYAGANQGLNRITVQDAGTYQVSQLFNRGDAGAWFIDDLFKSGTDIIAQSGHQFLVIDSNFKQNALSPPEIVITNLDIGGVSYLDQANIQISLNNNENNLDISFRINGLLSNQQAVFYQYRLKGLSENWTNTYDGKVRYSSLKPDNYTFEIKVRNASGLWSTLNGIRFNILPPFYQRTWFVISVLLLLVSLMIIYFKQKNLKTERSKQLILSNLGALKNQMNPHFIFNALNSIQYYIATNQGREANLFLAKLSDLVRNILSTSHQSSITLSEEILRINDYLELESMRLHQSFKYEIVIGDGIREEEIFVPPLLIQPLLENAIWHGMSDIAYEGKLSIHFALSNEVLAVEISDNGIGMDIERWEMDPSGSGSGNSIGLHNVVQRMTLLSRIKGKEFEILIRNIELNPIKGTIVKLVIPQ